MKMQGRFIISCLLLSIQSFGQTSDSLPKLGKLQVGLIYTPEINNRNIFDIHAPDYPIYEEKTKQPLYGYTTGIALRFLFGLHWALETGVSYSQKGFLTRKEILAVGNKNSSFPISGQLRYQYRFLEIPLKLYYRFGQEKINYSISAGVSANVLDLEKTEVLYHYADGHKEFVLSPHQLYYSTDNIVPAAQLSVGIHYNPTKKFAIMLEPGFTQFIGSVAKGWDYERDLLYAVGLRAGVFYRFNARKK